MSKTRSQNPNVSQENLKHSISDNYTQVEPPKDLEFEACVKCKIQTEIDFLDKFGRYPTCGDASPLRVMK